MANYEQKPNTGALFKNDKKLTDNHPDYKGSVNIDGKDMWISAWLKESKNGAKYMSLSFSPKETKPAQSVTVPDEPSQVMDEDIPF